MRQTTLRSGPAITHQDRHSRSRPRLSAFSVRSSEAPLSTTSRRSWSPPRSRAGDARRCPSRRISQTARDDERIRAHARRLRAPRAGASRARRRARDGPARKSTSSPSMPRDSGADLVVVDQLARVLDQRLLVVVERASGGAPATTMSAAIASVCSRLVCWSQMRVSTVPSFGMRADVPPEVGVVLDRPSAHHLSRRGASRSPRSRSGAGCRPAGKPRKTGSPRATSSRCRGRARTGELVERASSSGR